MEYIKAKAILQRASYGDQWFGATYNMNLYQGCPHGCIYCDSRSDCYGIEDFDRVRIKKDAIAILEKELASKRKKGIIGMGAMSDPYHPLEKKYQMTKQALVLIEKHGFGVSLETKSTLITRDIELFQKIAKKAPVVLKITITTADDKVSKKIEPFAPPSSERFKAIKEMTKAGIEVGILMTPTLPFITDTTENITQMIKMAHEAGAKYVFSMGGVTLRGNQRSYFYQKLDKEFPGLKKRYLHTYMN